MSQQNENSIPFQARKKNISQSISFEKRLIFIQAISLPQSEDSRNREY